MRLTGVVVAVLLVACGSSSSTEPGPNAGSGPGGAAGVASSGAAGGAGLSSAGDSGAHATGGAAGGSSGAGVAGVGGAAGSAGSIVVGSIVSDLGDHLIVHGVPKDAHLSAKLKDGTPITDGQWLIDDNDIGTLGDDHVFHANGFVGGVVFVRVVLTNMKLVNTKLTVDVDIVENSAALSSADQTALAAGGAPDPKFKFLYPYNGTVFPGGLSAPLLQFGDGKTATALSADALYTKLTTAHFSYQSYALAGSPVRAVIPEPVWRGLTLTAGPLDNVTAAVSKRTNGVVAGPVSEAWRIAQGTLKGLIYYNSYNSALLASNGVAPRGGTLSIRPGEKAKVVQEGCVTCHSVSSKGSVLSASVGPDLAVPDASVAYSLDPAGSSTLRGSKLTDGRIYSFAALTPDGSKAVTNGIPLAAVPPQLPRGLYIGSGNSGYGSDLINTATGGPVSVPGLTGPVKYAQTPSFSADGKKLAFINGDKWPARELATLDFDGSLLFSSLKTIVANTTEMTSAFGAPQPQALSWPAFTPDSAAIVYQQGDSFDSVVLSGDATPSKPQYAEIRLAELDGTVKKLNALNGRDANGTSYLPYGESAENRMDYEPATVPVAVGGYFWVAFTSRRAYGNSIAPGRSKTSLLNDDPTQDPWGSSAAPSPRKKLWLAAIDINHPGKLDPSHPALYVSGQELEPANQRPRPALSACQSNTQPCVSGADCCTGYCRSTGKDVMGALVGLQCREAPVNSCSNTDEACITANDCCDTTQLCIAEHCAVASPD